MLICQQYLEVNMILRKVKEERVKVRLKIKQSDKLSEQVKRGGEAESGESLFFIFQDFLQDLRLVIFYYYYQPKPIHHGDIFWLKLMADRENILTS